MPDRHASVAGRGAALAELRRGTSWSGSIGDARLGAGVVPASGPQRDVDEPDEDGDLDERADDAGEGLAGGDAEHPDRDGDRELEVVAGGGEGDRRVAVVREPQTQPGEERPNHMIAK